MFEVLLLVGVYAILGTVLGIGFTLRRLTKLIHRDRQVKTKQPHHFSLPSAGYAVWEWREARWRLISDNLPVGTDPGPPPSYPGAVDGETVKTWVRTPEA